MPEGRVSIGDFMIFLLQAGYAPADFIHFNLSYLTTFTRSSARYWSVGTKVQILKPSGALKGIAIGADVGFSDELFGISSRYDEHVVSFNIAASVGGSFGGVHLNMAYLASPASSYERAPFPTYIQVGTDMVLSRNENGGGMKLLGYRETLRLWEYVCALRNRFLILAGLSLLMKPEQRSRGSRFSVFATSSKEMLCPSTKI